MDNEAGEMRFMWMVQPLASSMLQCFSIQALADQSSGAWNALQLSNMESGSIALLR